MINARKTSLVEVKAKPLPKKLGSTPNELVPIGVGVTAVEKPPPRAGAVGEAAVARPPAMVDKSWPKTVPRFAAEEELKRVELFPDLVPVAPAPRAVVFVPAPKTLLTPSAVKSKLSLIEASTGQTCARSNCRFKRSWLRFPPMKVFPD